MFNFIVKFFATRKATRDRAKLVKLLSAPEYEFRTLARLNRAIGTTDSAYTTGLLATIGTRSAYGQPELIGLTARVGATARRIG